MEKVFASVRFSLEISVAVARTSQSPFPLVASVTDDSNNIKKCKTSYLTLSQNTFL